MSEFGIAVAQSCTFIAMLILLGVLAWHECDLTEFQIALIVIIFIMAAGTISVLLGALKCLSIVCVACPNMPVFKSFLSACYGTFLFIVIISVDMHCHANHSYVGIAALLYSILILIFFLQLCILLDRDAEI